MSFPEEAESWRLKAHIHGARVPVLVGVTALAALVLVFAGKSLVELATSEGFSVERAQNATEESAPASDQAEEENAAEPAQVIVHVGGAVTSPGVYKLDEGARVGEAIEAAGGFTEDAARDALNLARVLADGEQVVVSTQEEVAAQSAAPTANGEGTASSGTSGQVNINTASAAELDALPGVGPATAQRIVDDREANGPFSQPEDLTRVSGIGEKKFAQMADFVCVG